MTNGRDNPTSTRPSRSRIAVSSSARKARPGRSGIGAVPESFILIAVTKEGSRGSVGAERVEIDFDAAGGGREKNTLINELRREVDRWRLGREYPRRHPDHS
jgi:type III restriction enzyme